MSERFGPLAAGLAAELATIQHAQGSLEVTVAGEVVTADTGRDLRQVLSGHLYNHWHTRLGADEDTGSRFYRDAAFEAELAAHTPVRAARVNAVLLEHVPGITDDSEAVVLLDGVRVAVPTSSIVHQQDREVTLTVPAVRPSLSPGFWLVDGSQGRFTRRRPPLRVYLSIEEMAAAPRIWRAVLDALEAGGHRYRAKVGSAQRLYPRTDACVVYLDGDSPDTDGPGPVGALLAALRGEPGLGACTSVFTRTIAPGIAVATEPADPRPGMAGMSFGQHRCYAVATGVLDSSGSPDLATRVYDALTAASVNPADPAGNLPGEAAVTVSAGSSDGSDG